MGIESEGFQIADAEKGGACFKNVSECETSKRREPASASASDAQTFSVCKSVFSAIERCMGTVIHVDNAPLPL